MEIVIRPTEEKDLPWVQALWGDGDVMKYVGFPDGLIQSDEAMASWHERELQNRPRCMSYSIFDGDDYCGETYYCIDREHGNIASLDIKLFAKFRDKGIATKALSFTIEQAKLQGVEKVWVDPVAENKKAIRLYESLGFSACEMPKHILDQEGDDNVYMEKQL